MADLERHSGRADLPLRVRPRRRPRRPDRPRATTRTPSGTGASCCGSSGPIASGSRSSGRCGAGTGPATGGSPSSPRCSGSPASRPGTSTPTSAARTALQDALVAVRLGGTLESTEPGRRGNGSATLIDPARAAARFADHPEAVAESARLAERLGFDLNTDLGYSYPGAEDGTADRRLAEACRARFGERYDGTPRARRGRAPARAGAEPDLRPRAVRLLPPPSRHARAGPRDRGRGPRARQRPCPAPARAGPGLERQLRRLLSDRALPRRSGQGGPVPRPLPQRRDLRGARHRPRLPARHQGAADPARPRALRGRPLGPGRRLPHLPLEGRDPRLRQGPGPARRPRSSGRPDRRAITRRR